MPDAAPEGAVIPKPPEIAREEFIPTITIRDNRDRRYEIAANAVANRAHGQIVVSKLRVLMEKTLDDMIKYTESGLPMDSKAMKDITTAAKTIQEMSILAYEGKGLGEKAQSDLERLAVAMIRAGTEGAAKGGVSSYEKRREILASLGKKKQYAPKIIDVTPAPEAAKHEFEDDDGRNTVGSRSNRRRRLGPSREPRTRGRRHRGARERERRGDPVVAAA